MKAVLRASTIMQIRFKMRQYNSPSFEPNPSATHKASHHLLRRSHGNQPKLFYVHQYFAVASCVLLPKGVRFRYPNAIWSLVGAGGIHGEEVENGTSNFARKRKYFDLIIVGFVWCITHLVRHDVLGRAWTPSVQIPCL